MDRLTIFFDLDDTLYDRSIPYERAFSQFFGGRYAEKLPQAFDAVIHRGYEVFTDAHTGKISMEAMHIYRHQTGLADAGISITPDEALRFQALYAEQQRHITLSDTMRCVLDLCRERFAAVGVSLITKASLCGVIPAMPYGSAVILGVASLAFAVLTGIGCAWYTAFVRQSMRAFCRFQSNAVAEAEGKAAHMYRVLPSGLVSPSMSICSAIQPSR